MPIVLVEGRLARRHGREGHDPLVLLDAESGRKKGAGRERQVFELRVALGVEDRERPGPAQGVACERTGQRNILSRLERRIDHEFDREFGSADPTENRRLQTDTAHAFPQDRVHLLRTGETAPHDEMPQRLEPLDALTRVRRQRRVGGANCHEHGARGIEPAGTQRLDTHHDVERAAPPH